MHFFNRLATSAVIAMTLVLGACSSTPITPLVGTPGPLANKVCCAPPEVTPVIKTSILPHLDPAHLLSQKRSIYFDFDQYSVKPEYTPVLEMHGKYLAANAGISIRVEGNTDDLGGTEYNLALGQKRAEAVVRALKIYGARDAQLEAVSFGKEKPQATGHDEASHAQNRRGDLAYPQK